MHPKVPVFVVDLRWRDFAPAWSKVELHYGCDIQAGVAIVALGGCPEVIGKPGRRHQERPSDLQQIGRLKHGGTSQADWDPIGTLPGLLAKALVEFGPTKEAAGPEAHGNGTGVHHPKVLQSIADIGRIGDGFAGFGAEIAAQRPRASKPGRVHCHTRRRHAPEFTLRYGILVRHENANSGSPAPAFLDHLCLPQACAGPCARSCCCSASTSRTTSPTS